ncbi:cyclase [Mycolicibacterium moriokaense]|nr:cyclase [Mycolicibacterium moriokaense]
MNPGGHAGEAQTATQLSCRSCGIDLPRTAKFCHQCGAAVTQVSGSAEYKQVTVLFADVVRSMDIAATLDMERLRDIMIELLARSAAVARRFGGTVEHTGDGVMAVFGAPMTLEDHAFRACQAALGIQEEANRLASDVHERDGIELRVRVGLNSGRVIAGDFGSGSLGYRATGSPVGFAQRMESVAPPGAVVLSESTARLVEHLTVLGEPQWKHIKGADDPVSVRELLAIAPRDGLVARNEGSLVGRRWEMAALDALIDRTIAGRGGVVTVMGPPGIGKSRVAREAAALAADRGFEVVWAFCESHAHDVPFYAVTRLLRAGLGVTDADGDAARARVREQVPDADPQDLLLLDDLLGIADPEVTLPPIDPDARRRRLTALVNAATLARTTPSLFIIEDVHWIDPVSESLLADFLSVIAHTPSMALITARPEYDGSLTRAHGAQTIALNPLTESDTVALLAGLMGPDPSVGELTTKIAERASGNPFFAEEMVRELAQRGVLTGEHGRYVCGMDVADVSVPATVQAAIGARIDRLDVAAKRTVNAASVIGARFEPEMLTALGIDPEFDELLGAELIDQVRFTPTAEYAFRHPLIRTVAYESQLKSDRAQWHRRLAAAIEERAPNSVEENAALIAEHLQAAGELPVAYGWHMRAAAWSTNRDVTAARVSWEQACRIADALATDDPGQLPMRIAPRTMLCATDFQGQVVEETRRRFEELRQLCDMAGDEVSLAIGMAGLITAVVYTGRSPEAAQLISEQLALLESIGDPTLTLGLAPVAFVTWMDSGEFGEMMRWSQVVIDLADGDPAKGAGFGWGSPLAIALAFRGTARWWLGRPGWRQDLRDAVATARDSQPATFVAVVNWTHAFVLHYGVVQADEAVVRLCEEALQAAGSGNWIALVLAEYTLALALFDRDDEADRRRALELMMHFRDSVREGTPFLTPVAELWLAREKARDGDRDAAIADMRRVVHELRRAGRRFYGIWGAGFLVEALLKRGAQGDLAEADEVVDWLSSQRAEQDSAIVDVMLLRLRALLADARGDDDAYRDLAGRYREMAKSLDFEGHIASAEAMLKGR